MKKYIYILVLIFMCFFVGFGQVEAYLYDDEEAMKCNYADSKKSEEVENSATFTLTFRNHSFYDRTEKIIEITKYKGKAKSNKEKDENTTSTRRAILTNECPEYLAIYKSGGYQTFSGTFEEVNNWASEKGTDKVKILFLSDNVSTRIDNMQKMQGTHEIIDLEPGAKMFSCPYNNEEFTLNFNEGYWVELTTSDYINENGCPNIVYKVSSGTKEGYVLNSLSFPTICNDENVDVDCIKYTKDTSVLEEQEKKENIEKKINLTYTYKNNLGVPDSKNLLFVNVTVKKNNGVFSYETNNFISKYESSENNDNRVYKVYFAGETTSTSVDSYFQDVAFNGLEKHNSFSCSLIDDLSESYYVGLGETVSETSGVFICYVDNYKLKYDTYYFTIADDSDSSNNFSSTAKQINETLDDDYKNSVCASQPDSDECAKFQNSIYSKVKNAIDNCKHVYNNLESTSEDIATCDLLNKNVNNWASKGYFGDNIISVGDTGCSATLGSLVGWLKKIYNIVLLAVPVLIMIFGFKDFIRAILSGKEDELKKAGTTFIKRLIFGAVFVALPMLISLVIGLAFGEGFADICIFN